MTYEEAKKFLADCNQYAGAYTLTPLREMLARLGNPQEQLKFVHIAGTNGKGSTLAFVSSVLKEAGYRVGRYISPTIFSYRERIQINGQYIPREDLARLTGQIRAAGQQMLAEGLSHPTMFEAETALAFMWFAEQKCDLVVLEVGMGGKTDATNVISNTEVAALASISLDHLGVLGNTLEEIAVQKAGIIKPGCSVVTTVQRQEAAAVIRSRAEECGCPVTESDQNLAVNRQRGLLEQSFDYRERKGVKISLAGEYQFINAALALDVIDALGARGYEISEEAVRKGMSSAVWGARFSVIGEDPLFIVDGAHNRDAAEMLCRTIENYLPGKRIIGIMGVLADKEYEIVARLTAPCAAEIITVETPNNPRALPAEKLAETVAKYNSHVQVSGSLGEAVEKAYELADKEDVILAFGSLSYLGELVREAEKRKKR